MIPRNHPWHAILILFGKLLARGLRARPTSLLIRLERDGWENYETIGATEWLRKTAFTKDAAEDFVTDSNWSYFRKGTDDGYEINLVMDYCKGTVPITNPS